MAEAIDEAPDVFRMFLDLALHFHNIELFPFLLREQGRERSILVLGILHFENGLNSRNGHGVRERSGIGSKLLQDRSWKKRNPI